MSLRKFFNHVAGGNVYELWAEWRVADAVMAGGLAVSFPDSVGKGANNSIILRPGATGATRTGNILNATPSSRYYVPAFNIPANIQDTTVFMVAKMPTDSSFSNRFLYEHLDVSGARAGNNTSTALYLTAGPVGGAGSGYVSAPGPLETAWAVFAFSVQRSKPTSVSAIYLNGVAINTISTVGVMTGSLPNLQPFYFISDFYSNSFASGKVVNTRFYVGYMSPTEIAETSAEMFANNPPTP